MHLVGEGDCAATERARWALDHHALSYRYSEPRGPLDRAWLRVFVRQPSGTLVLPVLRDGSQVVRTAFQVVMHAEREGSRERLIPDVTAVASWNVTADRIIAAGRAIEARRVYDDPSLVVDEAVPFPARFAVQTLVRRRARSQLGSLGLDAAAEAVDVAALRSFLEQVRNALNGPYLVRGQFSAADIAVASSLRHVRPFAHGRASVPVHAVLAEEFADLLSWRDDIYARHRRRGVATPPAAPSTASVG